jgi:hypothetical protein
MPMWKNATVQRSGFAVFQLSNIDAFAICHSGSDFEPESSL